MEDRLETEYTERPGLALTALAAILVITAAWWALALWPVAAEPDWLSRTRAACFGSAYGSLPHAGGWILLIGEPIGMIVALRVLWGRSLNRDLDWLLSRRWGRVSLLGIALVTAASAITLGVGVARALPRDTFDANAAAVPVRVDRAAPDIALIDQHGRNVRLADFRGRGAVLTFVFGHCETVCPAIVHSLRAMRAKSNQASLPIVVVTLDPWRDTPERLPWLANHWQLTGDDRILSGSIADVEQFLDELDIARRRDLNTGEIVHGSTVMLLDENGYISWRADGGATANWTALPVRVGP